MKTVLTCHHCPIVKGHGHTYLCFIDEMQSVNSVLKAPVVLEGVPGGAQLNNGVGNQMDPYRSLTLQCVK